MQRPVSSDAIAADGDEVWERTFGEYSCFAPVRAPIRLKAIVDPVFVP